MVILSFIQIDKYLYSTDSYVVAGALLAIGIVNACVQNENDPAFALIYDYVSHADPNIRTGAILGLGLAYAGTNREEVQVGAVWISVMCLKCYLWSAVWHVQGASAKPIEYGPGLQFGFSDSKECDLFDV